MSTTSITSPIVSAVEGAATSAASAALSVGRGGWSGDIDPAIAAAIIDEGASHFDMLHLTGDEPFACREICALIDRRSPAATRRS